MVDVGGKPATRRVAVAQGQIVMRPETLTLVRDGLVKKGDVLAVARVAAIQATKRTAELIPLCHPLALTRVSVDLRPDDTLPGIAVQVQAETTGPTGVEMEALTGVQVALLTIYDMCKAADKGMVIGNVHLVSKTGGKSGDWVVPGIATPGM